MNYIVYKVFNFLLGGTLFLTIDYCANTFKNPDISAIVSLLPLSLISGYIIYDLNILKKHTTATIPTITITAIISAFLILLLKFNLNKYIAISLALVFWVIFQYLRIKLYPL